MSHEERLAQINRAMSAMSSAWPLLITELDLLITDATRRLIVADDEQLRGRIKALTDFKNLPETLHQEREGISAALSDEDAASQ